MEAGARSEIKLYILQTFCFLTSSCGWAPRMPVQISLQGLRKLPVHTWGCAFEPCMPKPTTINAAAHPPTPPLPRRPPPLSLPPPPAPLRSVGKRPSFPRSHVTCFFFFKFEAALPQKASGKLRNENFSRRSAIKAHCIQDDLQHHWLQAVSLCCIPEEGELRNT